jgi:hypothetical protein
MMLRSPVAREAPAAASSAQLPANASGAVVTPLFARGLPYTVTPKLPRWFASLRAVSFVIVVLLPVAVAAVYYLTIAADQYVAEFRLSLRTADAPRIEPLLIFGGDTAHTTAATESQIVAQF